MRRYTVLILYVALASGTGGFFLRRYELNTSFEPLSGLAVRGAPATSLLLILTFAFLALSALLAIIISKRHDQPKGLEDAFGTVTVSYVIVNIPVCLTWLGGTVLTLPFLMSPIEIQVTDVYFSIISVFAAVSIIFFAICMYQDPRQKSLYPLSIIPIIFLCFWLILIYRQNASNPVLLSYVYQCLAVISSALGFYYTAGFLFSKPMTGRAVFAHLCTILFCGITLADNHRPGEKLILCALLISAAISLTLLLRNLSRKHPQPAVEESNLF